MASEAARRADQQRRASHRTMYRRAPYTKPCPRCDAAVGESCRRPDRVERPAHVERIALYDEPPSPQMTIPGLL